MTEIDANAVLQGVSAIAAAALGLVVKSMYSSIKSESAERKEADRDLHEDLEKLRNESRELERSLVAKISDLITREDLRAEVDRVLQFLALKYRGE